MLEVYANEAVFGRRYLTEELQRLAPRAQVLEVGAGAMLLSCQLVREGYLVTALEPVGSGFSHFDRMRQIVLDLAREEGCLPDMLDIPGEELEVQEAYDLAFSINVMEHVGDVGCVLANVVTSLKTGARYRFTCPNYSFPYEFHFGLPTLFSKRLTEQVLGNKIFSSSRVKDPRGVWASLNWITVQLVRNCASKLPEASLFFDTTRLASTLERVSSDPKFAARHSALVRRIAVAMVRLGIHRWLTHVPAACHPVMDCIVTKSSVSEN